MRIEFDLSGYLTAPTITAQTKKQFMLTVANMIRRVSVQSFRKQADPKTGRPWAPTSAFTLRSRPGGGGRTLQDTGMLQSSVASARVIADSNSAKIELGTNLIYAAIHQFGGTIRARNARNLTIPKTRKARQSGGYRRFIQNNPNENPKDHWLLKPSVFIPERPFLGVSDQELQNRILPTAARVFRPST